MLVQSLDGRIPWRRAWQPTPVFLPGESHGQRSLANSFLRLWVGAVRGRAVSPHQAVLWTTGDQPGPAG